MLLLFCLISIYSSLDPKRVVLLDQLYNNYLVRSNLPLTSDETQFQLDQLLKILAEKYNLEFAQPPFIVLVNLMNDFNPWENIVRRTMRRYFKENPEKGKFVSWPITCSFSAPSPKYLPEFLSKSIAAYGQISSWDKLDNLTSYLNSQLKVEQARSKIILFHCRAGADRTGAVSSSYLMKYKQGSAEERLLENEEIIGRKTRSNCKWSVQWFQLYLKSKKT